VDAGQTFRLAWDAKRDGFYAFTITRKGTEPTPGSGNWSMAAQSPLELTSPDEPGVYEIVWLDPADGSILVRRELEVR
jgi:hypothetical protein